MITVKTYRYYQYSPVPAMLELPQTISSTDTYKRYYFASRSRLEDIKNNNYFHVIVTGTFSDGNYQVCCASNDDADDVFIIGGFNLSATKTVSYGFNVDFDDISDINEDLDVCFYIEKVVGGLYNVYKGGGKAIMNTLLTVAAPYTRSSKGIAYAQEDWYCYLIPDDNYPLGADGIFTFYSFDGPSNYLPQIPSTKWIHHVFENSGNANVYLRIQTPFASRDYTYSFEVQPAQFQCSLDFTPITKNDFEVGGTLNISALKNGEVTSYISSDGNTWRSISTYNSAGVYSIDVVSILNYNQNWKIKFIVKSGTITKDEYIYPGDTSVWNTGDIPYALLNNTNGNIAGSVRDNKVYYDNRLYVKISSGQDCGTPIISSDDTSIIFSFIKLIEPNNGDYKYYEFSISRKRNSSKSPTLTITIPINNNGDYPYKTRRQIYLTPIFNFSSAILDVLTFKPYTGNNYQAAFTNLFTNEEGDTLKEKLYSAFYLPNTTDSNVYEAIAFSQVSISDNTKKRDFLGEEIDTIKIDNNNPDIIRVIFDPDYGYLLDTNPLELNFDGNVRYLFQVTFTNIFGTTNTISKEAIFNFTEAPIWNSSGNITVQWRKHGSTTNFQNFTSSRFRAQKGMDLRFTLNYQYYSNSTFLFKIYLQNKGVGTPFSQIKQVSVTPTTHATSRAPINASCTIDYEITNEITDETVRRWYCTGQVESDASVVNQSTTIDMNVFQQCRPSNFSLTNCELVQDNGLKLKYKYSRTNKGITGDDPTISTEIFDSGVYLDDAEGPNVEHTLALSSTIWDNKIITIKFTSEAKAGRDGACFDATYSWFTNAIIVYNILPTVAYRRNQIGINTTAPSSNAAVDIHQGSGKDCILFQGVNPSNQPLVFKVNLGGSIDYSQGSSTYTLDFLNLPIPQTFMLSVPTSGWNGSLASGYSQLISDGRFQSNGYTYILSPDFSSYELYREYNVHAGNVTTQSQITFYADDTPPSAISINVVKTPIISIGT